MSRLPTPPYLDRDRHPADAVRGREPVHPGGKTCLYSTMPATTPRRPFTPEQEPEMRIRTFVGSMLAGGLMLAAVVPALAHAQTSAPTRASVASAPAAASAASHPTPASHPTRVDRQLQRL